MSPSTKPWAVSTGDLWSIPVPGVGHYPLVIARAPSPGSLVPFSFGYVLPAASTKPPHPESIPPLAEWKSAWIGLLPMKPFSEARWNRIGSLPSFDVAAWPITPSAHTRYDEEDLVEYPHLAAFNLCSIETTRDEPTMTVLDCAGVALKDALGFPQVDVITRASSLEKSLAKIAKGQELRGWDLRIALTGIDASRLERWRRWGDEARTRCRSRRDLPHPAGRSTDKRIKPGDWLGMPLTGGGFSAVLVARREKGATIFADSIVYSFPARFDDYPTIEQLRHFKPEDSCLLRGTSLIVVRDGRWRLLGEQPTFDPVEWVIPYGWHQTTSNRGTGRISVSLDRHTHGEIVVPEHVLALDPHASDVVKSTYPSSAIESDTAAFARKLQGAASGEWVEKQRVTPARISAWREQNKVIEATWK